MEVSNSVVGRRFFLANQGSLSSSEAPGRYDASIFNILAIMLEA